MAINNLIPRESKIMKPEDAAKLVELIEETPIVEDKPITQPDYHAQNNSGYTPKSYSNDEQYRKLKELSDMLNKPIGGISKIEDGLITELYLSEENLKEIPEQVYYLTSLQSLSLNYNKITSIDSLKNLANLQTLNLYNNKITNIDALSSLTNLQTLNLYNNKITSIDALSSLTNLQTLNLYNNKITSIDALSSLTNLQTLNLYNNKITNIDALSSLTNLQTLHLNSNQITSIDSLKSLQRRGVKVYY